MTDPFKSFYSFEWQAMRATNPNVRCAILLEAARHWRSLARDMMALRRSYGADRFSGVDGQRAFTAIRFAKNALAAI